MPSLKRVPLRERSVALDQMVENAIETSLERERTTLLQSQPVSRLPADAERHRLVDAQRCADVDLDQDQQQCLKVIQDALDMRRIPHPATAVRIALDEFVAATKLGAWDVRRALKRLRLRGLIRVSGPAEYRTYSLTDAARTSVQREASE